jgi:hypothetical protein
MIRRLLWIISSRSHRPTTSQVIAHTAYDFVPTIHVDPRRRPTPPKDPIWSSPEPETAARRYPIGEHGSRAIRRGIGADSACDVVVLSPHSRASCTPSSGARCSNAAPPSARYRRSILTTGAHPRAHVATSGATPELATVLSCGHPPNALARHEGVTKKTPIKGKVSNRNDE